VALADVHQCVDRLEELLVTTAPRPSAVQS